MSALTLKIATQLASQALNAGRALSTAPLTIAVLDSGGHLITLQRENEHLRTASLVAAKQLLRSSQLEQENTELRGLLDMRARIKVQTIAAEVLFTARDPFSRKVILERPGYKEWATKQMLPSGRWNQPEDLVGAVLFLASRMSDQVVGHVLMVDGGWTIQ